MTNEFAARISATLENELSRIYDEQGIKTGDITPEQALQWDEIAAQAGELFAQLVKQNSKEV